MRRLRRAVMSQPFNPIYGMPTKFYYDIQAVNSAYETLPGNTLATAQNDGIGAVLDIKRYKERGPELAPDPSVWTTTGSSGNSFVVNGSVASVDNTGSSASTYLNASGIMEDGRLYEISFEILSSNGVGGVKIGNSTENSGPYFSSVGRHTFLLWATGAQFSRARFQAANDWIGSINIEPGAGISIREIPGYHAIQDLAAAQPTLDIVGGARWAKFNGDDFLYIPNSKGAFNFLHNGEGGEMHIACRVSFGQTNYLFGNNGHAASAVGCTLRVDGGGSGSVSFMVSNGSGTPLAQETSTTGVVVENEPLVLSLIHEPGTVRVLKNGEEVVSTATVGDPSTADALDDFAIGLPRRGSSGLPMLGACQSWVPVQGILSDYDRQRLISYMMRRAGI